jgi:hypothetical protein
LKLYHYTALEKLPLILESGIRQEMGFTKKAMLDSWLANKPKGTEKRKKVAAASQLAKLYKGSLPAVWLTSCPIFEISAFAIYCTGAQSNQHALVLIGEKNLPCTMVRIEVDIANAVHASKQNLRVMLKRNYDNIASLNFDRYESDKWWFTKHKIPASSITSVSLLEDGVWVEIATHDKLLAN